MVIENVTDSSADLEWKPSENDGGTPITSYLVEFRSVTRTTWSKAGTVDASVTKFTAKDLTAGTEYNFRVIAVNAEGHSRPLEAKGTVKPMKELCKSLEFIIRSLLNFLFHNVHKENLLYYVL